MGLAMSKILDKFSDCNTFSLTGGVYNYNITEEEFLDALNKIKDTDKKELKQIYDNLGEDVKDYPNFEILYKEIENECYNFNCEKNKEYYLNKHFNDKEIKKLNKAGVSNEIINRIKKDFFHCSFIADNVGKSTKYGSKNKELFYDFYRRIAMNIDRENSKESFCKNNGRNPLDQVPSELKKYLLYYEVSFFNSVTISSDLMINYYFELNEISKKYLLHFRNDFCLNELEDLTFYIDNKVKFYSCTHEGFNSIEYDYKNMSHVEIVDFINDEYFEENNTKLINIITKLINMDINNKFSFKEIGISSKVLMDKVCNICDKLNLRLVSFNDNNYGLSTIDENGLFKQVREIPAIFCNLEDVIIKTQ